MAERTNSEGVSSGLSCSFVSVVLPPLRSHGHEVCRCSESLEYANVTSAKPLQVCRVPGLSLKWGGKDIPWIRVRELSGRDVEGPGGASRNKLLRKRMSPA
jgi:hypothetical protein